MKCFRPTFSRSERPSGSYLGTVEKIKGSAVKTTDYSIAKNATQKRFDQAASDVQGS